MTARVLIVGASGFVGRRLLSVLGPDRAIATFHRTPVARGIPFDASTMSLADTVLRSARGLTHAFILHGVTNIDACAKDPERTAAVNVRGTQRVIDDLLAAGVVPVFASSDAVFDGARGHYAEEDPVTPILAYGRQKVAVERYLLETAGDRGLVLRLSKVMAAAPGGNDLLGGWISDLDRGSTIRCAHDQIFSPVALDDAVSALMRLVEGGHSGVFHVCGPRPVSRLNLLRALVEEVARYRALTPRIETCSLRDIGFAEPRPLDASMSPRKLYAALGGPFEDYRDTCRRIAAASYGESARAPAGMRDLRAER